MVVQDLQRTPQAGPGPACREPGPGPGSGEPPPRAVRHPADRRLVPPRQLPRRGAASGWRCRRPTTRSTASSTCTRSPSSTTPTLLRQRTRVAAAQLLALGSTRSAARCSCSRTCPSTPSSAWVHGLHHRLRRGQPDDPVQGQVAPSRAPTDQRRPVHLPDPAGRGHPALPGRPGAGRRGPAPAPGADPRPRAAVQHPLRRDVHGARSRTSSRRPRRSTTCRTRRRR